MKTETTKGTVTARAQVVDPNNLCFDDMERDGENAIRSVQASLEAVQKLRSMLSSVKVQLNEEKRLRMKAETRANVLKEENSRLMRRVMEIRDIKKQLDKLENRKWEKHRATQLKKHGTKTAKDVNNETKTGKVLPLPPPIDCKPKVEEENNQVMNKELGDTDVVITLPNETLHNGSDPDSKLFATPDGEDSPCVLDPPYTISSSPSKQPACPSEKSVGWFNSREMCRITPPTQRCRFDARTSTTPIQTTVMASLPSKAATMSCARSATTTSTFNAAASNNSKSKAFMDKSTSVNVPGAGKRRRKRTTTTEEGDLIKNGSPTPQHKYHEVIRNKEERAKMTGVDCPECRDFLKMMEKQGLITDRQGFLDRCSRHRVKCGYDDENTPEDYWRLSFLDESPTIRAPFPGMSVYPDGFNPNPEHRK